MSEWKKKIVACFCCPLRTLDCCSFWVCFALQKSWVALAGMSRISFSRHFRRNCVLMVDLLSISTCENYNWTATGSGSSPARGHSASCCGFSWDLDSFWWSSKRRSFFHSCFRQHVWIPIWCGANRWASNSWEQGTWSRLLLQTLPLVPFLFVLSFYHLPFSWFVCFSLHFLAMYFPMPSLPSFFPHRISVHCFGGASMDCSLWSSHFG